MGAKGRKPKYGRAIPEHSTYTFGSCRVTVREVKGELDEVVGEKEDFHLEQMDDGAWWLKVGNVHVNLYTKRGAKIHANWHRE